MRALLVFRYFGFAHLYIRYSILAFSCGFILSFSQRAHTGSVVWVLLALHRRSVRPPSVPMTPILNPCLALPCLAWHGMAWHGMNRGRARTSAIGSRTHPFIEPNGNDIIQPWGHGGAASLGETQTQRSVRSRSLSRSLSRSGGPLHPHNSLSVRGRLRVRAKLVMRKLSLRLRFCIRILLQNRIPLTCSRNLLLEAHRSQCGIAMKMTMDRWSQSI